MTHTLSAKEQALAKIFSDEYVFTIPSYQRPYSWGVEQARELLDDLLDYMRSGSDKLAEMAPYFLGSIVLIKRDAVPDATVDRKSVVEGTGVSVRGDFCGRSNIKKKRKKN